MRADTTTNERTERTKMEEEFRDQGRLGGGLADHRARCKLRDPSAGSPMTWPEPSHRPLDFLEVKASHRCHHFSTSKSCCEVSNRIFHGYKNKKHST